MSAIAEWTPTTRAAKAFASFAEWVHRHVPSGHSIDLREPLKMRRRAICGEHGRVLVNDHGNCAVCDGYAEILSR